MTDAEFFAWLDRASPGETIEYHRGFLWIDAGENSPLPRDECKGLGALRAAAQWAWSRQRVHLLQRRHGDGDYSYLATVQR